MPRDSNDKGRGADPFVKEMVFAWTIASGGQDPSTQGTQLNKWGRAGFFMAVMDTTLHTKCDGNLPFASHKTREHTRLSGSRAWKQQCENLSCCSFTWIAIRSLGTVPTTNNRMNNNKQQEQIEYGKRPRPADDDDKEEDEQAEKKIKIAADDTADGSSSSVEELRTKLANALSEKEELARQNEKLIQENKQLRVLLNDDCSVEQHEENKEEGEENEDESALNQDDKDAMLLATFHAGKLQLKHLTEELQLQVICEALRDPKRIQGSGDEKRLDLGHERKISWLEFPVAAIYNENVVAVALSKSFLSNLDNVPVLLRTTSRLILKTAFSYRKISIDQVPDEFWQNDPEIALEVLQRDMKTADEIPVFQRVESDDFLRKRIEETSLTWSELPTRLKTNQAFANSVHLRHSFIATDLLQFFPHLRNEERFWPAIVDECVGRYYDESQEYARDILTVPTRLDKLADFQGALDLCGREERLLNLIDPVLANNDDFLVALIKKNPRVLEHLTHAQQLAHSDLVKKVLVAKSNDKLKGLWFKQVTLNLPPTFFQDGDFRLKCAQAGLNEFGVPAEVRHVWHSDKDVSLACLAHEISRGWGIVIPYQLCNDPEFMKQAIDLRPNLVEQCLGQALTDCNLWIRAFAKSAEYTRSMFLKRHLTGDNAWTNSVRSEIRQQLTPFHCFSECVLGNMLSTQSKETTGSNLSLLCQDPDTSRNYKELIADFLGIPRGKWLSRLLRAEKYVDEVMAELAPYQ